VVEDQEDLMRRLFCTTLLVAASIWTASFTNAAQAGTGAQAPASTSNAPPMYRVAKTIPLGGEGRWDYAIVDPSARLLYVTRQTHVQVMDLKSETIVADIKGLSGVHGVALAPKLNRGFISDGQANQVVVFDLKTHHTLGTIATGKNPDAIVYDPFSNKVFAFDGRSNDATAFDADAQPGSGAATTRIALDGKPEFAATDEQGHVYVNLEDKSSIVEIDSRAMKVLNVWKIDGGEEPSGLAIDTADHLLFAGCGNHVMAVVDAQTGKTVNTFPIGKGVDACGFDPAMRLAFASCGDGTLTIAKKSSADGKFAVAQTLQTRSGARTMALDPTSHNVYLPTAEFEAARPGQRRPTPKPGSFMLVVASPVRSR
jgi:DNA-binding beta-propeller fold protein YncE